MEENTTQNKSYDFDAQVMNFYRPLKEKKKFEKSNPFIRNGTSMDANIEEAIPSVSKTEFTYKIAMSSKEARESSFWTGLKQKNQQISNQLLFSDLHHKSEELLKNITALVKSTEISFENNPLDKINSMANHIKNIQIPIMAELFAEAKKPEWLFWVGSAGAFDDRAKKVTRDFARILHYLNIDFAILGQEESDSGDLARRTGNEMLFQMQAMTNIEILNGYEVEKIVTCDPHDFNTLKNEYPDLGGHYEVWHHSQFLQQQLQEGKLKLSGDHFLGKTLVFHDPCYLGRANQEFDAPRMVLDQLGKSRVEMPRHRGNALCCGAGGGQMFKEAEKGDREVYEERTNEALETGADIIATACPFCMVMLTDGIKYRNKQEEVKNYDLAELICLDLGLNPEKN